MKKINISKASVSIILFNVLLVTAVLLASVYEFKQGKFLIKSTSANFNILLLLAILIVIINSIIVIYDRYSLKRADDRYGVLKNTIAQIEALNNTLRAQRHDFLNQLQVIYSLMEMSEFDEAMKYVDNLYKDIQKVSKFLKTSSPAVNALLQAKYVTCEKEGIQVTIEVASRLTDMKIPAWDICRVLGNLIDNSIYALKNVHDKFLHIEVYQNIKFHGFMISNNGPMIEECILDKIFMPGFTTKGEHGEGMGLAIVQEIVKDNKGSVEVLSTPSKTSFEVKIPR